MKIDEKTTNRAKTDLSLLPNLVKIGFTKQEAEIYLILVKEGVLSAKEIASRMNILPTVVYRTIKKLEQKKLVAIISASPFIFYVLSPELSLSTYIKERAVQSEKEVKEISSSLQKNQNQCQQTKIDVLLGKQHLFLASTELINKAKKEVLIMSIGEPSTQDLILANKRAIERGVIVRDIVHKYDKENHEFVENLKKNGLEIRHYPDWGFHIVIVDAEKSLLAVNNPEKIEERVTIKIFSKALSNALRDYFYAVWEKAVKV